MRNCGSDNGEEGWEELRTHPILYLTSGDGSPVQQCGWGQVLGPSPASSPSRRPFPSSSQQPYTVTRSYWWRWLPLGPPW